MSALEYAREKFGNAAVVDLIDHEGYKILSIRREKHPVSGREHLALPLALDPEAKWANESAIDSMYAMFIEVYPD